VDSGRRCFLDHQAELGEQTRRLAQQVRALETSVAGARDVLEFCPANLRIQQHSTYDKSIVKLKKQIGKDLIKCFLFLSV
jgi:hypothetical protein